MKESTKKQIIGAMGIFGTAIAGVATAKAIGTSNISASSKLIASASGAIAGACAVTKATEVYLDGREKRKLEEEAEKRLKEKLEKLNETEE